MGQRRAFTLIGLLLVIAIIAPLVSNVCADALQDSRMTVQPRADLSHPSSRHGGNAQRTCTDGHVAVLDQKKLVEETEEARRIWNNDFDGHMNDL